MTFGWIAIQFGEVIHSPQRINPDDFGGRLNW